MKKLVSNIILLFFFQISLGQIGVADIAAEIKSETNYNFNELTARVVNRSDLYSSLKFMFSITTFKENHKSLNESLQEFLNSKNVSNKTLEDFLKSQDQNNVLNKESVEDFFTLGPYEAKELYKATVSTGIENKIIVLLLVFNEEDAIIAKTRMVLNDDNEQPKKVTNAQNTESEAEPSSDIALRTGIVSDDTKTKLGKDFFDFFYFYYNYNEVKGEKIVRVNEELSFGRRTVINIIIEGETIMQFFTQPSNEYLEEMAKNAVKRVFAHFQKLKREKSYITKY